MGFVSEKLEAHYQHFFAICLNIYQTRKMINSAKLIRWNLPLKKKKKKPCEKDKNNGYQHPPESH